MLATNLTNLIAKITNAGFRFTDANPIAIEHEILNHSKHPAFRGATFNVTFEGQAHRLHIALIPHQGYYSRMAQGDELD